MSESNPNYDPYEFPDDGEPVDSRCSCMCGCSVKSEGGGKCGMCLECCFCGDWAECE
jgi:hypothetical protein